MKKEFKKILTRSILLTKNLKYGGLANLSGKLNLGGCIPAMLENTGILQQI